MMGSLSIEKLKEIETQFGSFEIKQITGGKYNIYLRFGIWSQIDVVKLQEIIGNGIEIVEDVDYEEDRGILFMYILK
jgi:hypothetical protein